MHLRCLLSAFDKKISFSLLSVAVFVAIAEDFSPCFHEFMCALHEFAFILMLFCRHITCRHESFYTSRIKECCDGLEVRQIKGSAEQKNPVYIFIMIITIIFVRKSQSTIFIKCRYHVVVCM